jgi:hypothetical protein
MTTPGRAVPLWCRYQVSWESRPCELHNRHHTTRRSLRGGRPVYGLLQPLRTARFRFVQVGSAAAALRAIASRSAAAFPGSRPRPPISPASSFSRSFSVRRRLSSSLSRAVIHAFSSPVSGRVPRGRTPSSRAASQSRNAAEWTCTRRQNSDLEPQYKHLSYSSNKPTSVAPRTDETSRDEWDLHGAFLPRPETG